MSANLHSEQVKEGEPMEEKDNNTARRERVLDALAAFIEETTKGPATSEAYAALPGIAETFLKWS